MDADTLNAEIEVLAQAGIVLSTETKTLLASSLLTLKQSEHFTKIFFWGKIIAVARDYYIAQGVYTNEFAGRKSFFR